MYTIMYINIYIYIYQVRLLKVVQFSLLIHILGFSCFWNSHRLFCHNIKHSKCFTALSAVASESS